MGHMHGGAKGKPEKAKDFKETFRELLAYLGGYKLGIIAVGICAIASALFNIVSPKILGMATTELADGLMAKIGGTGGVDFDKIAINSPTNNPTSIATNNPCAPMNFVDKLFTSFTNT